MRHQHLVARAAELAPATLRRIIGKIEAFEAQFRAAEPARDERADENRRHEGHGNGQPGAVDQHCEAGHRQKEAAGAGGEDDEQRAFGAAFCPACQVLGGGECGPGEQHQNAGGVGPLLRGRAGPKDHGHD